MSFLEMEQTISCQQMEIEDLANTITHMRETHYREIKTLRARVAQLEAENAQLRAEWGEPVAFKSPIYGTFHRSNYGDDGMIPLYARKEIK